MAEDVLNNLEGSITYIKMKETEERRTDIKNDAEALKFYSWKKTKNKSKVSKAFSKRRMGKI